MTNNSYNEVMARRSEIIKKAVGIDYGKYEIDRIAFDYEQMMNDVGYSLDEVRRIQLDRAVGNTPLIELRNITELARKYAPAGHGARIFVKDEAANASGSYKARRAALSVYEAKKKGYKGVIAATSGNYGAAVASQAAMAGLRSIIVQETYDSRGVGQPEIIEKARKCEALGAEVVQLSVGPELFYSVLLLLEKTGYYNASLYTPTAVASVETLGYEIAEQCREKLGRDPDVVIATNAGGGNLTGTARGLIKANCKAKVVAASVNLRGLHMASDTQFNKKSFTTGHTGFGMPFSTWPDRTDVPRSAARPMRYMEDYLTVAQGEVFYITEMLATLEGLEKGPAGNTALAVAFGYAQTMPRDAILVVQETEYTGAGKHVQPQLSFARDNGIDIHFGNPKDEVPGESIILPEDPSLIAPIKQDMNRLRQSLIRNATKELQEELTNEEVNFLADETNTNANYVKDVVNRLQEK
ncbi:MAG TPA: PLP-dependent lyase/thiolase [Clostridiaceae bacterium]|nr:PLP-dependent lyase/thiolase [Clostridiaceae bacterium]